MPKCTASWRCFGRRPSPDSAGIRRAPRTVVKAVAGGSYRFALGNGLLVYGEYHYSGFGAPSAAGSCRCSPIPAFQERYLRGDTQILGRHALAALALYERSPVVSYLIRLLQSPLMGRGCWCRRARTALSDGLSMLLSGYVPYGAKPVGSMLQSDFGASPLSALFQLRIYR